MRDAGRQFMRAATSIGANLEEAEAAQSRADFISKCNIALKEAREARYWRRLIAETAPGVDRVELERELNESRELVAILTSIVRRSRENSDTIRDGEDDQWLS